MVVQEANVKLGLLAEQISEDFRGAGAALTSQSEFDHLLLTAHWRIRRFNDRPATGQRNCVVPVLACGSPCGWP